MTLLSLVLSACGGSSTSSGPNATSTVTRQSSGGLVLAGAPGSVTLPKGQDVPLGLTPAEVSHRLGEPAVSLYRKDSHYRCMLYDLVGQPPSVQLQYCFRGGKLKLLASYVH